jgi:hypothetical protein
MIFLIWENKKAWMNFQAFFCLPVAFKLHVNTCKPVYVDRFSLLHFDNTGKALLCWKNFHGILSDRFPISLL